MNKVTSAIIAAGLLLDIGAVAASLLSPSNNRPAANCINSVCAVVDGPVTQKSDSPLDNFVNVSETFINAVNGITNAFSRPPDPDKGRIVIRLDR